MEEINIMFGPWWVFIGMISCGVLILVINIIVDTLKYEFNPSYWVLGWASLILATAFSLIFFLPLCIGLPLKAHSEVVKYKYDYEMVQEVVLNGKDLENIAITETILSYNNWLSEAKADKEAFGNWSIYYKEDLDSLKPIVIVSNNN